MPLEVVALLLPLLLLLLLLLPPAAAGGGPCTDAAVCARTHAAAYAAAWGDAAALVAAGPLPARSPCFALAPGAAPRRWPHGAFCLPAALLAGFPKCGTTALFEGLARHPLATPTPSKEPHWLTRCDRGCDFSRCAGPGRGCAAASLTGGPAGTTRSSATPAALCATTR
jgi:hypothetical protein